MILSIHWLANGISLYSLFIIIFLTCSNQIDGRLLHPSFTHAHPCNPTAVVQPNCHRCSLGKHHPNAIEAFWKSSMHPPEHLVSSIHPSACRTYSRTCGEAKLYGNTQ